MTAIRASLISQIALLAYFQVIEWISLFPWNDIRHGNGQAGLDYAIGAVMLGSIVATARRWRVAVAIATGLYAIWIWLQIETWWVGYLVGASPGWKRTYARFFSQTVQVLPRVGDHLPPDACHLVLQLMVLAVLATTAFSTVALWRGQKLADPMAIRA